MKRIQIQKTLLLSLLFSTSLFARTIDRVEYALGRVLKDVEQLVINGNTSSNCTPITQNNVTSGGGTYTITESGAYCVEENISGTIVIAANNVCIDLGCHIVSAGGGANAFSMFNQSGITISNGTVSYASDAGIIADNCLGVELSNLYFANNDNDAIQIGASTEVYVHNVNVLGGTGVRALGILNCSEVFVENCEMSGYVASIGTGILEIISGNEITVRNVDVSQNNFITLTQPVAGNIHVVSSTDVVIEHSRSNLAISLSGYSANGILIDSCTNCTVSDCQVNQNATSGIEIVGTYGDGSNLVITDCIAMANGTIGVSGVGFDVNATAMSAGTCVIENCIAMSNWYGFASEPSSLQTTFIGNIAHANGSDYAINGGAICWYALSLSTGMMTLVSGQPTISNWTNISIVP